MNFTTCKVYFNEKIVKRKMTNRKVHLFLGNVVYTFYGVMGFAYLNRIGLR